MKASSTTELYPIDYGLISEVSHLANKIIPKISNATR